MKNKNIGSSNNQQKPLSLVEKIIGFFGVILIAFAVCFIAYGFITDCPNTAGYVHCELISIYK